MKLIFHKVPVSFYVVDITWPPINKGCIRKENYGAISLMNMDAKTVNKLLANEINNAQYS